MLRMSFFMKTDKHSLRFSHTNIRIVPKLHFKLTHLKTTSYFSMMTVIKLLIINIERFFSRVLLLHISKFHFLLG